MSVTDFDLVRITRSLGILACLAATCAAGCGGGDDTTTATAANRPETTNPLPDLPPAWTVEVNRGAGFALGVPPGWIARTSAGQATLVHSPDRRVAVSITADRTDESLGQPLEGLVRAVATSLQGQGFKRVRSGRTQRCGTATWR